MNVFRTEDAFEFVDAVRRCNYNKDVAEEKAKDLAARMKSIEQQGKVVPSYLLAAYRGYEFVISGPFGIVRLDDSTGERT